MLKLSSRELKRFFILYFVLILLLVIITSSIYFREVDISNGHISKMEFTSIESIKDEISHNINYVTSDILLLSGNYFLQNYFVSNDKKYLDDLSFLFLSFSQNKKLFDQVRFIDESGMELVRINFNGGDPYRVSEDKLQFIGDRYYFRDTFELDRGEIYVSPLDLNIENGEVEQPLKPMIRIGTPVFDSFGNKKGILIFNYLSEPLLHFFEEEHTFSFGDMMLLNSDGFWLKGPIVEDEWGFMFEDKQNIIFGNSFFEEWNLISGSDSGQFYTENGLFSFVTVYLLTDYMKSSDGSLNFSESSAVWLENNEYYWKIVSHISLDALNMPVINLFYNITALNIVIIILSGVILWYSGYSSTKRKLSEDMHMLSEEKFHHVVHSSNDAIISIDKDGIIISWNRGAEKMFGYKKKDMVNKLLTFIMPDRYRDSHTRSLQHSVLTAKNLNDNKTVELDGLRSDGTEFPIELSISNWKNVEGTFFTGIIRDISERKQAFEDKMDSIKTVNRGISHDLRNPLSTISGAAYLLKDASGKQKDRSLEIINDSVSSIDILLRNLVEFDKELELQLSKIDIQSVIVKVGSGIVVPKNIEIIYPKKGKLLITVDVEKIKRVFLNLFTNSIQAMPKGGKLIISVENKFSVAIIIIKDSGVGISKEHLSKLFIPYFTTKKEGIGIGLANSKKIVEAHKGEIKIESIEGKGTTVTIKLPLS